LIWLVYCHQGDHRIVTKGASRQDAWLATLKAANDVK
jgi:hypothetical protein